MTQLLDSIALRDDVPEHGLRRGQTGVIVAMPDAAMYVIEFADGRRIALAWAQVQPLDHATCDVRGTARGDGRDGND